MINGIVLYSLSGVLLTVSLVKDKDKTKNALIKAWKMFINILPDMLAIMLLVGIVLTVLTPTMIAKIMGENSGVMGIVYATIIGSIAIVPSFIVFPLGKTLIDNGADYPQVAVLMSTLMAVGLTILPMEKKFFGNKFTYLRTISAVVMCLIFGLIIKVVM
ncbi:MULTISPECIES: hypothetical protein [Vagococcus]|uniref:Permease n=1 Tax=Vagococcus fluvialis bH819 TaxID=1255619 RepID=A0A1X6WT08_9ENTE|nr:MULTISPECIES: hypothetical protein [Vagococcus]SLM86756.1 hypothetical protein FM121_11715 [Vagococcus fluvialis bH819]HCM88784.1 hypothetical protein [Vagococcus sp.]